MPESQQLNEDQELILYALLLESARPCHCGRSPKWSLTGRNVVGCCGVATTNSTGPSEALRKWNLHQVQEASEEEFELLLLPCFNCEHPADLWARNTSTSQRWAVGHAVHACQDNFTLNQALMLYGTRYEAVQAWNLKMAELSDD